MRNKHINKNHSFLLALPLLSLLIAATSCGRPSEGDAKAGAHIEAIATAAAETTPTPRGKNDDSADDPAIWINKGQPEKSIIIGTDKKGGLATYRLDGSEIIYFSGGQLNNCDLRYGFPLNGDTIDILAASNRTMQSVSLFRINDDGGIDTIHSRIIRSEMTDEVYGLAMYQSRQTGLYYVFVNSKAGEVEQWELSEAENGVDASLVRSFRLGTQTEGMVADDETGILYVGEERAGIWKYDADPKGSVEGVAIANSSEENRNIRYDIEGLAIYPTDSLNGFLIASSQGNYSYAVFERQGDNRYLGSFRITDGNIDGVEETDGLDVSNVPMPGFPRGILVVQDGFNYDGRRKKSQNYKIIDWQQIDSIISVMKQ
ncbi:MAG: phytase [Bacteroidales bacterium]|nr:phytase [Bacteroidales bacterium]